ncbi:TonB-dependent receptor [Thalassotalea litorea]|uniref:TonB-dependent receptor n=1 Tax=Thalassotalea litorea TaxID=2020715 RepID=A0A5R9IMT8_9GAMM|nr:TonB-dependent receptor [Thalassotalea litorea]TLU66845.1 TonB-dependent receptor [Thalassotalea litorea]
MTNFTFKKSKLATTLSLVLGATTMASAGAQESTQADGDEIEVIEVTGIKGSVIRAMDVKRSSTGIVDAISAEDMGKFPDTNLAESLQRISGVSIDRNNGEGQKVTVRGFSSSRNLVLINGRQLANTTGDRSFNFDNLAAEGISGLEVYKTSMAKLATGGLGATINLNTNEPLAIGKQKASFSVKGVNDSSTEEGSITPELSGIYSNVFADGKFGISLTANYAERESGSQQAEVGTGWRSFEARQHQDWGDGDNATWGGVPYENQVNRPDPNSDDIYSVPQTTIYKFEEQQRKRLNSHLVLQYDVSDNFRATVDAMYIEKEVDLQYNDISAWYTFAPSENVWSDGPVSSPLLYSEYYGEGSLQDLSMGARNSGTREDTTMIGLNLEWQVTDNFWMEFDVHTSDAVEEPNNKYGSANTLSLMARIREGAATDFSGALPVLAVKGSETLSPELMEVAGSWFRNDRTDIELDQAQWNGSYDMDEFGSIDFGAAYMNASNHRREAPQIQRDDWGGMGAGVFDASQLPESSIHDKFDVSGGYFADFQDQDAGSWNIVDRYYKWDFNTIVPYAESLYGQPADSICGTNFCPSNNFAQGTDRYVEETITSIYFQYNYEGEIGTMPFDVHFGLRHEQTEIDSTSAVVNYEDFDSWVGETEFYLTPIDGDFIYQSRSGDYSHTLPSINLNLELTDDLIVRAAYSETINRPYYGDLSGGTSVGQGHNLAGAGGGSGNPGLLPLESDNWDFSVEWYYAEGSYLSAAYFDKTITNAITTTTEDFRPFDINTPIGGQRWNEAVAAVGIADKTAMRNWIYDNYADGETVYLNASGFVVVEGVPGDPLLDFAISVPSNSSNEQGYDGLELTAQHLFGESGFGVIANYTFVNTDNTYDNTSLTLDVNPETDISDTANLIAFYEKDGFQIRIAYNWRDEFLKSYWENAADNAPNPVYTEEYEQFDISASYDLPWVEGLTVFLEGINITDEYTRKHGRSWNQVTNVTQTGARYALGARYSF